MNSRRLHVRQRADRYNAIGQSPAWRQARQSPRCSPQPRSRIAHWVARTRSSRTPPRKREKESWKRSARPATSAAEERGLTPEGLKDVASEVAGTFKDAMSGSEGRTGASQAGGSGSGQSFGIEQNRQSTPGSPTTQPHPTGRSTR